ncbi:hypothetical protein B0T40_12530 [Chromobacterium haemolyticum]|uniref:DUF4145 domain-containing protein n=1 Tax=Chromobacterium haemolyticum TaxID=394935 RepID=UPI0009F0437A|nr:DUF4145 domain-containing protein [Chromobacterium haemolyticum]OQS35563.1 hypothetical protein B0T40_12530 [Chromobacterium haemolyticum]
MSYVMPEHNKSAFNCPHCNAYAQMEWTKLYNAKSARTQFEMATCTIEHCQKSSVWMNNLSSSELLMIQMATAGGAQLCGLSYRMIYPQTAMAPMPSEDLPEDCKREYLEARDIAARSPRGAAALLRLTLQMLCKHLGFPGKNINDDIQAMVRERRLSEMVQQACDAIRVVGNNAVHPGELDVREDAEIVPILFEMVNIVTDEMISKPNKTKAMFNRLPDKVKESIKNRDASKKSN